MINIDEELVKQKQTSSGLFNLAPDPYILLDEEGVITHINIMGTSLFGLSKESMVGTKFSRLVILSNTRDVDLFLDKLNQRMGGDYVELAFELPNKTVLKARIDGTSLKQNGRITYHLFVKSLTKSIETADIEKHSEERLKLSLEASHAGTWELKIDTMRFYLLLSSKVLCPIPISGFDGSYRTFTNYIHPEDQQKVEESFRKAIDSEVPIDVICRFPTEAGEICYGRIKGQYLSGNKSSRSLAGILMNVTDQVIAEQQELNAEANKQRLISMATIQAGENERRRISDILHDSVNQLLYGVKLKIDVLKSQLQNISGLVEIDDLVDQAINDVRNISFTLAPSILIEFGLPATLEELAGRLSSAKMQIRTSCFQNIPRPAIALELNIFRITQELVNNCLKHSDATVVDVKLRLCREITIEVSDNGKGFDDLSQMHNPSGAGLSSIKYRLAVYNGTLKVDSVLGMGTSVTISFGMQNLFVTLT